MVRKGLLKLVGLSMVATLLNVQMIFAAGVSTTISSSEYEGENDLSMEVIGHYNSQSGDEGTEIVAYASAAKKMYVVNGAEKSLDIVDISDLKVDTQLEYVSDRRIALGELEGVESAGDITSVAVSPDESFVAVCVPADPKTDDGRLVVLDTDGNFIASYETGSLPDMVTISGDNKYILVANEGEPNDAYTIDPEGSVTIIDVSDGPAYGITSIATFEDTSIIEDTIRKANPQASYSESLEPEYISVDEDSSKAYVSCQESNAIAVLDLKTLEFSGVYDLGAKDYSLEENAFDLSDKDGQIAPATYPVLSYLQPDGIEAVTISGKTYIFTANEGDSQDYDGYSEEARVEDILDQISLNADYYDGFTQEELDARVENGLFDEDQLGRLKITLAQGQDSDGVYEALYGYGGRSFSIYDAETMEQIYDSGNDFEEITAKANPDYFNSNNDENNFDNRSDDKGVEPENVVVGDVDGRMMAFIGFERFGGIIAYDVTDVENPIFEMYTTTRTFDDEDMGDLAPEGLVFVDAADSPTGQALLMTGNEVSGTVTIYQLALKNQGDLMDEEDLDTQVTSAGGGQQVSVMYQDYTVKAGDRLWKIAETYGTTWQNLQEINDLKDPDLIYEGQVIQVPQD